MKFKDQEHRRIMALVETDIERVEAKIASALKGFKRLCYFGQSLTVVVWICSALSVLHLITAIFMATAAYLMSLKEIRDWRWYATETARFQASMRRHLEEVS